MQKNKHKHGCLRFWRWGQTADQADLMETSELDLFKQLSEKSETAARLEPLLQERRQRQVLD